MQATNELRFVEREIPRRYPHDASTIIVRVLQQKWKGVIHRPNTGLDMPTWEWRDVPLVKEEA